MTPPHHFDRFAAEWRNLTLPRGKEAWEQEIFRLGVSIELQVLTAHTDAPLKMTRTAGSLRSKKSH